MRRATFPKAIQSRSCCCWDGRADRLHIDTQAIGVADSDLAIYPNGIVEVTDQRYLGIQYGVVYDFDFGSPVAGSRQRQFVKRHERKWGFVYPSIDLYPTTLGFSHVDRYTSTLNSSDNPTQWSIPLWPFFALCLFSMLKQHSRVPLRLWRALKQGLRERRLDDAALLNVCVACRYDLTGNTSGFCPECGTKVVKRFAENDLSKLAETLASVRAARHDEASRDGDSDEVKC